MSGRFGSYRTSYGTSYRRRGRGRGGLTGNQLKTLGGLFLLLDHIGAVVIQGGILHGRDREAFLAAAATDLGQRLLALSQILRYWLGGPAAPSDRPAGLSHFCVPFDGRLYPYQRPGALLHPPGGSGVYFRTSF